GRRRLSTAEYVRIRGSAPDDARPARLEIVLLRAGSLIFWSARCPARPGSAAESARHHTRRKLPPAASPVARTVALRSTRSSVLGDSRMPAAPRLAAPEPERPLPSRKSRDVVARLRARPCRPAPCGVRGRRSRRDPIVHAAYLVYPVRR